MAVVTNKFDNCAILCPTSIASIYDASVDKVICISEAMRTSFLKMYQVAAADRYSLLDDDWMRVGWAALIYVDEMMRTRQGVQFSKERLGIRYFKEFSRDAYYLDPSVKYETYDEFTDRFNRYFDPANPYLKQNTMLVDSIETMIPTNADRKLPDGSDVGKPGADGWVYNLVNVSQLICLFSTFQESSLQSKYVDWVPLSLSWVYFAVAFNGSENINRYRKLMGAGVGSETRNLVPPSTGNSFKIIHNSIVGSFNRQEYQDLLERLDLMANTMSLGFQGFKNMVSQCLYSGMTGYTTVKRVMTTYEDRYPFGIMKDLFGSEYQTMLEALASAWSESRKDLNPYYMFGVDNDRIKYAQTKFVRIIQVCCQIAIQVDGETSLKQYAYGKGMDRLTAGQEKFFQKAIDKLKEDQESNIQNMASTFWAKGTFMNELSETIASINAIGAEEDMD